MKTLISLIFLLVCLGAFGQPIQKTPLTTNLVSTAAPTNGQILIWSGADGAWHTTFNGQTITNLTSSNLVGKLPVLDASNLFNFNISGATISNINTATMQNITLISNVPTLLASQPYVIGTVSGKAGSRYWTNASGWNYTNSQGNVVPIPRFSLVQTGSDQPDILSFPSSTVAFTDQSASSNFTSALAHVNPPYIVTYDTTPRIVGALGDAGSFFLLGADEGNEPTGIFLGGLTNFYRLDHYNDSSGYGLCFRTTAGGVSVDVVVEFYDGAPEHSLDVKPNGTVKASFGIGSEAVETQLPITATGITNTWTNNAVAYVTCTSGSFTNFDNAGNPTQTNLTVTFTNQLFILQPGASIIFHTGGGGTMNAF
jgi:hypothetical protein